MSREKICAISVCINYSDYLSAVLPRNLAHFDDYIVVTCERDQATRELCEQYGVTALVADAAGPWGDCFDSAYTKSPLINLALEHLDGYDGWVAIVDADILLTEDFRERLEVQELYPRALYGLYSRIVCESWEEFVWRARVRPWESYGGYHPNVLGYFQLFKNDGNVRYPLFKESAKMHDDICFQFQFKPSLRRLLPIPCVHLGHAMINWSGRRSRDLRAHDPTLPGGLEAIESVRHPLAISSRQRENIWIFALDLSVDIEHFLAISPRTTMFDTANLDAVTGITRLDADRRYLNRRLDQLREDSRLEVVDSFDWQEIQHRLASDPPDLIYLPFEVTARFALDLRSVVGSAGEDICVEVVGHFYGFPKWMNNVFAINCIFGFPDLIEVDGTWSKMLQGGSSCRTDQVEKRAPERPGANHEATLFTVLRSPREIDSLVEWLAGPLASCEPEVVVFDLTADPGLSFLADRLPIKVIALRNATEEPRAFNPEWLFHLGGAGRVVYIDLPTAIPGDWDEFETAMGKANIVWNGMSFTEYEPFDTDLLVHHFDWLLQPGWQALAASLPIDVSIISFKLEDEAIGRWSAFYSCLREKSADALFAALLASVGSLELARDGDSFLRILSRGESDDEAQRLRLEAGVHAVAPTVHCRSGVIVIVVVREEELAVFQEVSSCWRLDGHSRIIVGVVADGAVAQAAASAFDSCEVRHCPHHRSRDQAELAIATEVVSNGFEGHLVFLNPLAAPVPGANLFFSREFDRCAFASEAERDPDGGYRMMSSDDAPVMISAEAIGQLKEGTVSKRQVFEMLVERGEAVVLKHACALGWELVEAVGP